MFVISQPFTRGAPSMITLFVCQTTPPKSKVQILMSIKVLQKWPVDRFLLYKTRNLMQSEIASNLASKSYFVFSCPCGEALGPFRGNQNHQIMVGVKLLSSSNIFLKTWKMKTILISNIWTVFLTPLSFPPRALAQILWQLFYTQQLQGLKIWKYCCWTSSIKVQYIKV